MFDKGDNSPPWDFPMENPNEQQNNTSPPSTESSSAVKSYPLIEPVNHKKKKSGHVVIFYGVGALMAACFVIFIVIRLRNHSRKLRRPASSEGSQPSLPVSMPRGKSNLIFV